MTETANKLNTVKDCTDTKIEQDILLMEECIIKWTGIIEVGARDLGTGNCPLCDVYLRPASQTKFLAGVDDDIDKKRNYCFGCPIMEETGEHWCEGSPYVDWAKHQMEAHNNNLQSPDGYRVSCKTCLELAEKMMVWLVGLKQKLERQSKQDNLKDGANYSTAPTDVKFENKADGSRIKWLKAGTFFKYNGSIYQLLVDKGYQHYSLKVEKNFYVGFNIRTGTIRTIHKDTFVEVFAARTVLSRITKIQAQEALKPESQR